jgi:hypothetical protein
MSPGNHFRDSFSLPLPLCHGREYGLILLPALAYKGLNPSGKPKGNHLKPLKEKRCQEEINQPIPISKSGRPSTLKKATRSGAYPKRKPKKEPGQRSTNRTTGARKAVPAGVPGKIPLRRPKEAIQAARVSCCGLILPSGPVVTDSRAGVFLLLIRPQYHLHPILPPKAFRTKSGKG